MEHHINPIAKLTMAPSGQLHVVLHKDNSNGYSEVHQQSIIHAFMQSQEHGLLQLLTAKIDNNWSLPMKYWRNFIAQYIDQLCHYTTSEHHLDQPIHAPNEENLQEWLLKIPPCQGVNT